MNKDAYFRSGLRIVVALSIALRSVVSPLCSPLCAATVCSSGKSATNSGLDGCHHASVSTADAYDAIAAPQLCNLIEMPAATLRDAKSSIEKHPKRIPSLHASFAVASESRTHQL